MTLGILPKWFANWGIIWAKGQLDHSYTFWTMPILIFSPVQIIMRHPLPRFCELCSIKPCYLAGWILVECYVVAYLNPNFTEKQADARDVQEIEHGVCNISSDENSDENQMWVSIIWKSIIKIVFKIESYMWLWCKSQATYLMRVKNYGRHVQ